MDFLLLEDGSALLLESGSHLLLEGISPVCPALLLESGDFLLLEDGSHLLLEGDCGCVPYEPVGPALLLEDGFYLLLEDCSHLLLEGGVIPPEPPVPTRNPNGQQNKRSLQSGSPDEEDLEIILMVWLSLL